MDSKMSSVRTYPPPQPHTIMTSNGRAHTEPPPMGFIASMMRRHDVDDFDEGVLMVNQQEKKITQEEQDEEDKKARRRAMKNLVNSWQERLQLISVITTFFATTEAAMLVNTNPSGGDGKFAKQMLQASNACLIGSLIMHVYASVLAFMGAFLLIRYKLKEATRDEMRAQGIEIMNSPAPASVINDIEQNLDESPERRTVTGHIESVMHKAAKEAVEQQRNDGSYWIEPPLLSSNPHVEQVGLFASSVSSHLLSRAHGLCVFLAVVGFVLAITGIICYAWALESLSVKIFATSCFGFAVFAMVILFI